MAAAAAAILIGPCSVVLRVQRAASSAHASSSYRKQQPQLCMHSQHSAMQAIWRPIPTACGASQRCRAATSEQPEEVAAEEEDQVLTPEEDWTVPGGYQDSLSSNTPLGRAVRDACDELETLGNLEKETIDQANKLLAKLGYTVSTPLTDEGSGQEGVNQ